MLKNELYREHALEYAEKIRKNIYNAQFERPSFLSLLPNVNQARVLDLGCGSGEYSTILFKDGAQVTAIDGSKELVSILKDKNPAINSYVQDLEAGLPNEKSETFDLVIAPLMIHYIRDLCSFFLEISRVLKSGGTFIFSTHSPIADYIFYPPKNYYKEELITDTWKTIGFPTKVEFYRRPLSKIFQPLFQADMVIQNFTEGNVNEALKAASTETYLRLSSQPSFIFVKAKKV